LRIGSEDSRFLSALESLVLKSWEKEPNLPLLGQCWLHRFERHALALADTWAESPAVFFAALLQARRFNSW